MRRNLIVVLILTGFLTSCSNERNIYLQAKQVDGLTTESAVTLNGFQIGKVEEIGIDQKGNILIKLELNKEPSLPKDSKFMVVSRDLLGTKGISVEPGSEKSAINPGDTIDLLDEESLFQNDSFPIKVEEVFETLTGAKARDSILYELRRLNENLEGLKK